MYQQRRALFRGPELTSQHPHHCAQLLMTPASGDPMSSHDFQEHCTHVHTHKNETNVDGKHDRM